MTSLLIEYPCPIIIIFYLFPSYSWSPLPVLLRGRYSPVFPPLFPCLFVSRCSHIVRFVAHLSVFSMMGGAKIFSVCVCGCVRVLNVFGIICKLDFSTNENRAKFTHELETLELAISKGFLQSKLWKCSKENLWKITESIIYRNRIFNCFILKF